MRHEPIKPTFIYPDNITEKTYTFGGGQIDLPILREDGDWRDRVPEGEEQKRNGVESSACYVEAQQHGIATIQEEVWKLFCNYTARFNALLSNGTPYGGNPITAAESIRKDGLISEDMMPFDKTIESWDDFHSWKGANEKACRAAGQLWLSQWKPSYHVVFQRGETIERKQALIRDSLKCGPVALSMYAWVEVDGIYIKPQGVDDTHLVLAVYMDAEGYVYVWDTYLPFLKKIAPNTNFDFAMQWTLEKLPPKEKAVESFWEMIIYFFKKIFYGKQS